MQYRKFGKLDWKVSALGIGTGWLPRKNGEIARMVQYAIERGVNYIDIGLPLEAEQHEATVRQLGQSLKNGYRQKVKLALMLPVLRISSMQDMEDYLETRLKWLETDRIDFLVPGWLDRTTWPSLMQKNFSGWAEKAQAAGKIDKLGLAFHDQFQYLKEIISAYNGWSMVQFQYSFMDVDHHPGASGLKYAWDNGLGVVVSETLRGGRLVRRLPEPAAALWASSQPQHPPWEWGLRWAWNHPEISTAVVDISSIKEAEADIALAEIAKADSLTVQEEVLISKVRDAYRKLKAFPCTACRSCMPCPLGIDAPRIFEFYNDALIYNDPDAARSLYRFEGHSAESCNECGTCVKTCGREIDIPRQLKAAHKLLGGKGGKDV